MTPPRSKPRWSAEKRAAKGNAPRSNRRNDGPTDGPMNRKQRRALQFGDRKQQFEGNREQHESTEHREQSSHERSNHSDRGSYARRDDRDGDRRQGGYNDRRRDDRGYGDRRENSYGDRRQGGYNDRNRDDRPRDDRRENSYGDRRQGGYNDRNRDDRGGYNDRRQGDRFENRDRRDDRPRDDRYAGSRDDRPRFDRDRDRDRPKFRSGSARFDSRRSLEPRGRDDRRGRSFDRDDHSSSSFDSAEGDQMSWTATTAEAATGDVKSGFFELGVAEPMVRVLAAQGITEPFPIQAATIGDALTGRDVLGRGRTGSGKTLAFGLPMLTRLAAGDPVGSPRAVILTPTRELALQIADNLSPLAATVGIDLTLIAGGMSYGPQIRAFERGVDVVVATPGRLIDLIEQGAADLSQVQVLVLDEADHMADLGFLPDVETVLDAAGDGQRLLFSATLDNAVGRLVKKYLKDPVTHEVDSEKASVTTMVHRPLLVKPHHKNQVTAEIANREGRTVLFARTQLGTDRIAAQLREAGVMAGALHGGLTQGARARILAAFKDGHVPVLVATDVAARGIHVDDVTLVLQVDPPHDSKDYTHRAGRTARAGHEGVVASIVLPHQRKMENRILTQAGVRADFLPVEPGSPELREATGARPTSGVAIHDADYQALIAPKQQPRRRPEGGRGGQRGRRNYRRY